MGSLKRFNLGRIIKKYNVKYLFETGTWKGDGIAYAMNNNFEKIYSSEIIDDIAQRARERFKHINRIEIITGSSTDSLKSKINELKGNSLFWLDAHFPGAEEGLSDYNNVTDDSLKLPLEKELEIIAMRRGKYNDVILIDDLRIYMEGPFKSGNMPANILPPKVRNIQFIENHFGSTHHIVKSFIDEGYVLLFPKQTKEQSLNDYIYGITNQLLKKIY